MGWIHALGAGAEVGREPPGGTITQAVLPPVFIAKRIDKASPLLTHGLSSGQRFEEVQIEMVEQGSSRIVYRIVLRDVLISSAEQTGEEGEAALEELRLSYAQIEWTYAPASGPPVIAHFDKERNQGDIGPFASPTPTPTPTPTPSPDSDGDGMPDDYEIANGLNPNANDSDLDLDLDGQKNIDEFRAGTFANNPNSVFRVSGMSRPGGVMSITWNSVAGKVYHILGSSTFEGPYVVIKPNIPSAGTGQTSTTVPISSASLFYMVQTQ